MKNNIIHYEKILITNSCVLSWHSIGYILGIFEISSLKHHLPIEMDEKCILLFSTFVAFSASCPNHHPCELWIMNSKLKCLTPLPATHRVWSCVSQCSVKYWICCFQQFVQGWLKFPTQTWYGSCSHRFLSRVCWRVLPEGSGF